MKEIKAIETLLPLLKLYPWIMPVIVILGIVASIAEGLGIGLLIPFLQSLDSSAGLENFNNPFIAALESLFVGLTPQNRALIISFSILSAIALKAYLSYLYGLLSSWLTTNVSHQLRCRIYQQLMSVSQSFLDSWQSGKLVNTIALESTNSSLALTHLIWLTINVCTIVIFTILLLFVSWQLTLLMTVALGIISGMIHIITRKTERLGKDNLSANIMLKNLILESVTGMKTIRAFGRQTEEQKRFEKASKKARNFNFKLSNLLVMVDPLSEGLSVGVLICVMFFALQNQFTLPVLVTFIFMLYRLQPQVKNFDINRLQILRYISSVKDVLSFLETSDKPYIRSGSTPFNGLRKAISLKEVTFYYNDRNSPAISNISISVEKGKTTALVGPSGAGKSTLINLICRFYDVNEGEIYADGRPLKELNLHDWRSRIALVSQDIYVFNTTVRENIAYGRPAAKESEIVVAAKQANAHEFICKLPQGYDTFVGDRGVRLSGGQRQRISIARAILCNPEILILDEATNSLDSISEQLIQEAIDILSQNRTVIAIAHRLSTIENADWIIVLENGRVLEEGRKEDLLKRNGLFARLYQIQYSNGKF